MWFNRFKRAGVLGGRALAIGVVSSAIFLFGHTMTPSEEGIALARVYTDLSEAVTADGIPLYGALQLEPGRINEAFFNGNRIYYTMDQQDRPIGEILDYYEQLYATDGEVFPSEVVDEVLDSSDNEEARQGMRELLDFYNLSSNNSYTRWETDQWGAYVRNITGNEGQPGFYQDAAERAEEFMETGRMNALGDAKVVMAFRDGEDGQSSTYFNLWFDDEASVKNLVTPPGWEDAPGYDEDDIQRYPGDRRTLTFSQNDGFNSYTVLTYQARGTTIELLREHYLGAMQAAGWGVASAYVEGAHAPDLQDHLSMGKGERNAMLTFTEGEAIGDPLETTIVITSS